jgi:hypothetical protein
VSLYIYINHLEVEIAIVNYKFPDNEQFLPQLVEAGGESLLSQAHKRVNIVWNIEELPEQWKECVIVPLHKQGDDTDCSICGGMRPLNILPTQPERFMRPVARCCLCRCVLTSGRSKIELALRFHEYLGIALPFLTLTVGGG